MAGDVVDPRATVNFHTFLAFDLVVNNVVFDFHSHYIDTGSGPLLSIISILGRNVAKSSPAGCFGIWIGVKRLILSRTCLSLITERALCSWRILFLHYPPHQSPQFLSCSRRYDMDPSYVEGILNTTQSSVSQRLLQLEVNVQHKPTDLV